MSYVMNIQGAIRTSSFRGSLLFVVSVVIFLLAIVLIILNSDRAGAVTETTRPNGDISAGWPLCTGAGCGSAHYTTIDEASNSTADFINTGEASGGDELDEFAMTSVAGTINSVSQIDVRIYANSVACNSDCDTIDVAVRIDGVLQTAQSCTMTTVNSLCTRTFNGSWTGDDDLQIQLVRRVQGSGNPSNRDDDVRVTYVDADVTYEINYSPDAPTLSMPSDMSSGASVNPTFQLRTTEQNNEYVRYLIEVCSTSNCTSVIRTIDQTVSQTGWSGQDTQGGTAYVGNSVLANSTIASHSYQNPSLNFGTQYWWRARAIDPGGTNSFGMNSSIFSFTTQAQPSAPTLISPADSAIDVSASPNFQMRASDPDNDYLRYLIEVCSTSNCSSVIRTIDQTASQTGWSGQDAQGGTAYVGNSNISNSTIAIHSYQDPELSYSTQYWWRARAIDPGGASSYGSNSSIRTFITRDPPPVSDTHIQGGTIIQGGTNIGL